MKKSIKYMIIGIITYIILLFISLSVEAYCDYGFICENTGSTKGYREWIFGVKTGHWYEKSALEAFIQNNYPDTLENRWTCYEGTGKNIFGRMMSDGHGVPGPIMQVPHDLLSDWIKTSKPEEVYEFYTLLASDMDEVIKAQKVDEFVKNIIEDSQ